MKKYQGKYESLLETALTRFQQAGFLTGDAIKVKKNALSNAKIKDKSEQYKERLKAFISSDMNIRVSAIKTQRANSATGIIGGADAPEDYYVDIVQEINPGRWVNPLTVPMDVIERIDSDEEYQPIPDSSRRENNIDTGSEDFGAVPETRTAEDLNLPSKNTKLSNSNSWDDDKPGAGNTKGLKKPTVINASVTPKQDADLLAECYVTNILAEADEAAFSVPSPYTGIQIKGTLENLGVKNIEDLPTDNLNIFNIEDALKNHWIDKVQKTEQMSDQLMSQISNAAKYYAEKAKANLESNTEGMNGMGVSGSPKSMNNSLSQPYQRDWGAEAMKDKENKFNLDQQRIDQQTKRDEQQAKRETGFGLDVGYDQNARGGKGGIKVNTGFGARRK